MDELDTDVPLSVPEDAADAHPTTNEASAVQDDKTDTDGPSESKRLKLDDTVPAAGVKSKRSVAVHGSAAFLDKPASHGSPLNDIHPGNYQGYYSKRRFNQDPYIGDERLARIPKEWMQDKRVLDIGCNAGKVTVEIAQTFGPYRITGVDIDADLIKRAQRQIRESWSTQEPLATVAEAAEKERNRNSYRRRSPSRSPSPVPPEKAAQPKPAHFPAAMSRMFGFLPGASDKLLRQYVLATDEEAKQRTQRKDGKHSRGSVPPKRVCLFPHNLQFKHADWVNKEITADKRGYDCILAFSVSKWIHLNGGDEGLIEFFTRVFTTLHPAGRFILEPQPWSSYAKASRMSDELKQSYQTIKYRPDDFERILLEEIGFQKVEKLSDEDSGGFRRPLHVYIKAAGSWL